MTTKTFMFRPLAAAVVLLAAGSAQAALTGYTSSASFAAAVSAAATDTFSDISYTSTTVGPLSRTVGSYSYSVATSLGLFFGAPVYSTTADPALSANTATDTITFSGFSSSVKAIGANLFDTDLAGLFVAGSLTLTITDSLGATVSQTLTSAAASTFQGFVSTGSIVSLAITAVQPADGSVLWPTIDNLQLATTSVVPEPGTTAMLLAGLGMVGFMARRRQA